MPNDTIAFPGAPREDAREHAPLTPTRIDADAPWRWIGMAATVYRRHWPVCAGYGLVFTVVGAAIAWTLASTSLAAAMPVAIGAFALIGPLMAGGIYTIPRADEHGERPNIRNVAFPKAASPGQIAYLGVMLLVSVCLWAVTAIGLYAMFAAGQGLELSDFASFALTTVRGIVMVAVGSVLGAGIAFGIFAVSAFSIPILMDREIDFARAIGASVESVKVNAKPMALWAWIIAQGIALGGITLLLGFVVIFPVLGIATWIGYRETFPS